MTNRTKPNITVRRRRSTPLQRLLQQLRAVEKLAADNRHLEETVHWQTESIEQQRSALSDERKRSAELAERLREAEARLAVLGRLTAPEITRRLFRRKRQLAPKQRKALARRLDTGEYTEQVAPPKDRMWIQPVIPWQYAGAGQPRIVVCCNANNVLVYVELDELLKKLDAPILL